MDNKNLSFGVDGRNKILDGIEKLSSAVKITLGPRGKNVVIEGPEDQMPLITKDGVTVAQAIKLKDPIENLGAQMVKSVASSTNITAGDGTTTATVLAEAIYKEGLKNVAAGANPTHIKRGIDKAVDVVVNELHRLSTPVTSKEDIAHVGSISANGDDEIGNILATAMETVGQDGTITVDQGRGMDTTLTVVEGMQFNRGYLSSHFITNVSSSEAILINPMVLIYENDLNNMQNLLPFLQRAGKACKTENRPLLIIADSIEAEVLSTLVVNKLRGSLNVCVIKSPEFGDNKKAILEDLAIITGGTVVGETLGRKIENVELTDLGSADKIIITKDTSTIIGGNGKVQDINDRISHLKSLISSDDGYDIVKLKDRVAKLSGGIAIISVGGASETEMHEKYHRVEDALHAVKAAVAEGVIPGGGSTLIHCIPALDALSLTGDAVVGVDIIKRALTAPLEQIVNNSGLGKGAVISEKIMESDIGLGYNALTDEYENMVDAGILDPVKVTRCALQNAASIASLLLTTSCVVYNAKSN